jgi:uncharacterized membrane protein YphA (DoxX/SURF4 family)
MKFAFLLGRLIFGGFFLYSGINHFRARRQMVDYARTKGVPLPDFAIAATGVALLIGGASLLLGIKPRVGALSIAGFLAGVSPVMHNFWKSKNPEQRMHDMVDFSKNMAMLGAALALMSVKEPWPVSVANKRGRYETQDIRAA